MGNSNSSRKITVPNEEAAGVIKVSDSVAKRIRSAAGDSGPEKGDGKAKESQPSQPACDLPPQYSPHTDSLTALQIRQQKEVELKKNDEYWMKRLQRQQETHKIMNRYMEEQYECAISEVKDSFFTCPDPKAKVPCQKAKEVVASCYREHPNEALKCNEEVLAFQKCVDCERMSKIESRG